LADRLTRRRLCAEDPEHLGAGSQALRTSVVPFDKDLELIGVEDVAVQTDPETCAKKLDSIALARDARELDAISLRSSSVRLWMRRRPHASPFLSPDLLLPWCNWGITFANLRRFFNPTSKRTPGEQTRGALLSGPPPKSGELQSTRPTTPPRTARRAPSSITRRCCRPPARCGWLDRTSGGPDHDRRRLADDLCATTLRAQSQM
jgi:hypothetical protein